MSPPRQIRTRALLVSAVAVAAVAAASFHSLCAGLFGCGCRPPWAGGIATCNVHAHSAPHCPFCTGGGGRALWIAGVMGACALLGLWLGVRRGRAGGVAGGLAGGLAGYLAGALLAGILAAAATGYPRLLGIALPW